PFVLFVEKNRKAAQCIEKNLALWGVEKVRFGLWVGDLFDVLKTSPEQGFGLVFIDPPYYKDLLVPVLEKAASRFWLEPGGFVLAEVEAGTSLTLDTIRPEFALEADRKYGQTRILLWKNTIP
ncbi:MAG: RsmD family RNA methyltransferase, partial [Thermodesulfobacteriota bacterium]|nr:RsmD family RNA methyltransferase [Thermodesulfobacteriota bacterium]